MRIAICEDLPCDCDHLSKLLSEYFIANRIEADVDIFISAEALLEAFQPGKYQIIFQDIYMTRKGISGMQAAERIRKTDEEVSIIFTTTSTEHGHASYAVDAAYYLVKPVDKNGLEKALNKCRKQLDRYARMIELTVDRQLLNLRLRDIYYAEVIRHYTLFRTVFGEVKTRMTYEDLTEGLGGFPFITCHRSYVINLVYVVDIQERDFIMKNGDKVPISKTYKEQTRKAFKEYFWGRD